MRRTSYRPYVFLILFFLSLMSLPKGASEKIRSGVVSSLATCWRGFSFLKSSALNVMTLPSFSSPAQSINSLEFEQLSQENHLLKSQVENVRQWLLNEDRIQEQMLRYKSISSHPFNDAYWKDFFSRRSRELCQELELQSCSLPAKVIFREPASWSSTFWINLGEKHNESLGKKIVGKNSPVLLGTSIVGVVEYVGRSLSRVRLITDASLTPSVRAIRGDEQNRYLMEHLQPLLFALELREDLFSSKEQMDAVSSALNQLKSVLEQRTRDLYLAKGELRGTSHPLWRSRSQVLKGIGFNYDFADEEGAARDLRSGAPYGSSHRKEPIPLLRPGDLLVTTGLDGIFPPGFRVGIVSSVQTLKEGASSYEIEASSTAGNLNELTDVFVLPPLHI